MRAFGGALAMVFALSLLPAGPAAGAERVVRAPAAGAHLPAAPVWIRVRAPAGKTLRATLNGRSIGSQFSAPKGTVRSLQVSPSHGLVHGTNVLRVRVGTGRTATVRFAVAAGRPLAAAGVDRSVAARYGVVLDGRRSRPGPGVGVAFAGRARAGAGLRYRWTLLRVPRSGRHAALTHARSATPRLHTDAPGTYTLRLTVTDVHGRRGSDLVSVRADPPPSARLTTNAHKGDQVGIRINGPGVTGDAFYPGDPKRWMQLLVLNRRDLTLVSNTNYDCPQSTLKPADYQYCIDAVRKALAGLDGRYLVVVQSVWAPMFGVQPPYGFAQALTRIGVIPWAWWSASDLVTRGTFAAVGVPGARKPEAQRVAPAAPDRNSVAIDAGLIRDNEGNYGLAEAPETFSTQAAGSDAKTNVVQIAGHRFVQSLPTLSKGFQVVIADPDTLVGTSYFFDTADLGFHDPSPGLQAMTAVLRDANNAGRRPFTKPKLIVVASRGDVRSLARSSDMQALADQIEAAGGTRNAFYSALLGRPGDEDAARTYSLVGRGGGAAGSGQEATGTSKSHLINDLNPHPIGGTVARTAQYSTYALQTPDLPAPGDAGEQPNGATQIVQMAGSAPSAWPEAGNKGRTAAIAWLGEQVLGTDAPRAQFWTLPYAESTWRSISDAIGGKTYTATDAFDAADLAWAKRELGQEIRWLITTHEYTDRLAKPFQESQFSSWADLQEIAAKVNGDIQAANDTKVTAQTQAIINLAFDLGSDTPIIGKAFEFTHAIYNFAMEFGKVDGEPAENEFHTTVAEAGAGLARRMTRAQEFITRQVPNAIAADYDRLKTVGTCASVLRDEWKDCPTDHAAWVYTQDDQHAAANAMHDGALATAYATLLPAKYILHRLPAARKTNANKGFAGIIGFKCRVPFELEPATGQYAKLIVPDADYLYRPELDTNVIYALGYVTGAGLLTDQYVMHVPGAAVTDRLFGNGPDDLGAQPERFFDRFFESQTLDHFPERDTPLGWKPECS